MVGGTGVLVGGTGVRDTVRVAVGVLVTLAVMVVVMVTVDVTVWVIVAVAVSVCVAVAVSVDVGNTAVSAGALVADATAVCTTAVAVLGRRVGGLVTTIDVAVEADVGGMMINSTVRGGVVVVDGVTVTVAFWMRVGSTVCLLLDDEFANCVLIRMMKVIISPSASGRMMFSGIFSGRKPGRFGKPLRASRMLRRRG